MSQIGFCCISLLPDGSNIPNCRNASMTVTHVAKLDPRERTAYVHRAVVQNLDALSNTVEMLAAEPPYLRMFRLTSGLLPLFTHASVQSIYREIGFANQISDRLRAIGSRARSAGVRLSLHPGQFTVLNSAREDVRVASLEEFEYHTRIGEMLGFAGGNGLKGRGGGTDSFAINIHGGAWRGDFATSVEGWRWSWPRLSAAARRMITLENDEMSWGAAEILRLCEALDVRMVLDVHHHWVRSEGEWLDPFALLSQRVLQTWHGQAPKLHVSAPAPELVLPSQRGREWLDDPAEMLEGIFAYEGMPRARPGISKTALRTHANYLYHPGMLPYLHAWGQAGWSIMTECKAKNLAAHALYANLQWAVICNRPDLVPDGRDPAGLTLPTRHG